jgi:hypothetical protein
MTNLSYSEFIRELPDYWEVDFEVAGKNFHYERAGNHPKETWIIYLSGPNGEMLFHEEGSNPMLMTQKVLTLKLLDGKTLQELWDQAEITNLI